VESRLWAFLQAAGYSAYDPFGLIPGSVYADTVRLFVAHPAANWVRVLSDAPPPPGLAAAAAPHGIALELCVTNDSHTINVYMDGQPTADAAATLAPYARDDVTVDDLRQVLNRPVLALVDDGGQGVGDGVPLDVLPDDVQQMAGDVDAQAASRMFQRVTKSLFGKSGGDQDAAGALLQGAQGIDWERPQGATVRALMGLLTVPAGWRVPGFATLQDAYSLHTRRQRKPNARLYPGDAETMAAVPDALMYTPIYAGKDA